MSEYAVRLILVGRYLGNETSDFYQFGLNRRPFSILTSGSILDSIGQVVSELFRQQNFQKVYLTDQQISM